MSEPPWGSAPHASALKSEPAFNAPAGVLLVIVSILGGYLLQSLAAEPEAVVETLGLSPQALAAGRWWTPATVMIVHGGWLHAGLNAMGALAFGTPVARRLGRGPGAVALFLAFYLVCGVLASAGYLAVHWRGTAILVGASGAISGLMGAASRLLDGGPTLAPFRSRTVLAMAAAWGFINVLMALRWIDVGGAPVAWQAHLFGYAAGLVLLAPTLRLAPGAWRAPLQPRGL